MTREPHHGGPPLAETQGVLTIDLGALVANWRLLRDLSAPAKCAAVVKADAYGIGSEHAAKALHAAGCRTFFVAQASEGVRVRAALKDMRDARIFALNGLLPEPSVADVFVEHGLRPVLGSLDELRLWLSHTAGRRPFALHFNTGMNRLGIEIAEAEDARAMLAKSGAVPELLMSHFVSSEVIDDPLNQKQIDGFAKVRQVFPGIPASVANSSGIFLGQKPYFDLVRPGYALYGGNPTPNLSNPMRSVVKLEAPIIQLRNIEAGETVGYNAQWTARRPTRLATIGIGYADGFPRSAMNTDSKLGAEAVIGGVICPFAGRVSMDLIVIDVTDAPGDSVYIGAPVELLGEKITVDDLGARSNTIGYEILTGLGRRYHRRYVGG